MHTDRPYWKRWEKTDRYNTKYNYFFYGWTEDSRLKREHNDPNKNVIFINGWYRHLLGIPYEATANHVETVNIKVRKVNPIMLFLVVLYAYPFNHPQNLVRLTGMLAIIGLGLIGTYRIRAWFVWTYRAS